MIKKTLTAAAVVGSAFLFVLGGATSAMAAPGDDIVVNGNFDAPGFDSGSFAVGDDFAGWEVIQGFRPDGQGAPFGEGIGIEIYYPGMGGQKESLGAPYNNGPWVNLAGTISQTLPTEANNTYLVSYSPRVAGWVPESGQWQLGGNWGNALIDGEVVSSFQTVVGQTEAVVTFMFTATGSETVLSFANAVPAAVGLDTVSVIEVAENDSPIMIPAIAGGLGIAALGAGSVFALRRKNKLGDK